MNLDVLKKPQAWAAIIPVLVAILVLYTTINALGQRKEAKRLAEQTRVINELARDLLALRVQFGGDPLRGGAARDFMGLSSARDCAEYAGIHQNLFPRFSRSKPVTSQDGQILQVEHYELKGVSLVQVVQFLDYAERSYSSLSCPSLILTPLRTAKNPDSWSANFSLNYLQK